MNDELPPSCALGNVEIELRHAGMPAEVVKENLRDRVQPRVIPTDPDREGATDGKLSGTQFHTFRPRHQSQRFCFLRGEQGRKGKKEKNHRNETQGRPPAKQGRILKLYEG